MSRRRRGAKQKQFATKSKQDSQAMKEDLKEVDGNEGMCLAELWEADE